MCHRSRLRSTAPCGRVVKHCQLSLPLKSATDLKSSSDCSQKTKSRPACEQLPCPVRVSSPILATKICPRRLQEPPRCLQDASKSLQDASKMPPRCAHEPLSCLHRANHYGLLPRQCPSTKGGLAVVRLRRASSIINSRSSAWAYFFLHLGTPLGP